VMAEIDSQVIAAVDAGLLLTDEAGRVVRANERSRTILGRDLTGSVLTKDEFDDDLPVVGSLAGCYRRAAEISEPCQDLVIANNEDGPIYYWVTISPATASRTGGGHVILMVDIGAVFSESPVLQRVFSQVNHDLRSPLTSIAGAAELLLSGRVGALEGVQRRLVTIMEEGTRKMSAILTRTKTHLAEAGQAAGGGEGE
jgi:signal transduction histidine kinase